MWKLGSYDAWIADPANLDRRREIDRSHRTRNNAAIREREIAFHMARPLYSAVKRAKQSSAKRGIPFDLDDRALLMPKFCPVLGIELRYGPHTGGIGADSPSLDRLIPSRGYVHENVRVISHRANTIKSDATAEELRAVLVYVEKEVDGTRDAP